MSHKNEYSNLLSSKVIGIQFGIMSPDEIRKQSVCEIITRDTYDNGKPKIGGLFDPRMGVLEPGLVCPTDGLDYINTPGYFGHINLAKPVFYIQYLSTIIKILKCICFKCSKLKISKEKFSEAMNMNPEDRWNFIFSKASVVLRCGQETNDGCGCKQPSKIRKEGLATLYADFALKTNEGSTDANIKLTPEYVLKIFKRITDDDIEFMGFSKYWSRPEWMICQVFAVPPPSVRPSIKHDAQQRSEDDLTHIIISIIKTNNTLKEKLNNANESVQEDWHTVLQYYIATIVDNKLPGVGQCCQRSGRPLKSLKDRLNGKTGRVRGNLMGKRVDYSARSVITADPNLSIRELGVPLKVAMNITKPVTVNERNIEFLKKLVQNGSDKWPGAKILQKKNRQITLRYIDKSIVNLDIGDIVHRHMLDGDPILFNRQPTLHRMSMMCHIAKIMKKSDTFRMNVADTKPYNADFDGDEMNLHMPQDNESDAELLNLAAVPYQIISPANNSSIVGIFQDSALGAFQFTRKDINFNKQDAMNLLMNCNNIDLNILDKDQISSFDILSQIMPNMSIKNKTKLFDESENKDVSNNIIEIDNGKYIRGNLEKGSLGSNTSGILQRICNNYGNMSCSNFIDNFQNIITDYMKTSSFSVGISDLISNEQTKKEINEKIISKKEEVKVLIEKTHFGILENETGKSNKEVFEMKVNSILNEATEEAGKSGKKSLNKDNHFVTMVNAGSKGSILNLSFMISCLGQQNVNSKRIPYGLDYRTLPHFQKFDDSPRARGFVESSYINGLAPEELFFHAMGGRTGLIDTAVKTSQTGYIQRRLIKGMEDLKLEYDMTVRNSKGKIVQYSYGDDGIDTCKIENQTFPLVFMSNSDIFKHFALNDEIYQKIDSSLHNKIKKEEYDLYNQDILYYIKSFIETRDKYVEFVNKFSSNQKVHLPVGFQFVINNIQKQLNLTNNTIVDITPLEFLKIIRVNYNNIQLPYLQTNELFKTMYFYFLSPINLINKNYNKLALIYLLENINLLYKKSIIAPGEMVGMIAAQSIGEPTTQMTLNTFHFAGVSSKSNVTRGVPRIEEILALSANTKNPSLTIHLKDKDRHDKDKATNIIHMIENTSLQDVVDFVEICYEPNTLSSLQEEDQKLVKCFNDFQNILHKCNEEDNNNDKDNFYNWIIRMKINDETLLDKNITMNDIHFAINNVYNDQVTCCFSDYNSNNLIFRIHINKIKDKTKEKNKDKKKNQMLDQSDDIHYIKSFQEELLKKIILRGVPGINKVMLRNLKGVMIKNEDKYVEIKDFYKDNEELQNIWVLDTDGTNLLNILSLDYINSSKTFTNDIVETYNVLGIEAARQCIYNEIVDVIEFDGTYINSHHIDLLCDRMCYNTTMVSIFRHGINNDNIGAIAKASFEETPEMFLRAARHGELDDMHGVSSNIMCGQEGYYGTGAFKVVLDIDKFQNYESDFKEQQYKKMTSNITDQPDKECNHITIENNINNIIEKTWGDDNDYIPDGL